MRTGRHHSSCLWPAIIAAAGALCEAAAADVATIGASKDNTLYEAVDGAYSNGAGDGFFVGRTNAGLLRRGVITFDIAAAVPAGSTITAVTLKLHMSRSSTGSQTINLYRMTSSWGEGISVSPGTGGAGASSEANDATWIHRFYPTTLWTNVGGDRVGTSSGSKSIAGVAFYTWGSPTQIPQMIADVQSWLNTPAQNFGWMLIGNEGTNHTSKKFDSRENPTVANRPVLTITYTPPPPVCAADWNHDGSLTPVDVALYINDWYLSLSQGTLVADYDHNGVVNAVDVALLVNDWFAELTGGC